MFANEFTVLWRYARSTGSLDLNFPIFEISELFSIQLSNQKVREVEHITMRQIVQPNFNKL